MGAENKQAKFRHSHDVVFGVEWGLNVFSKPTTTTTLKVIRFSLELLLLQHSPEWGNEFRISK